MSKKAHKPKEEKDKEKEAPKASHSTSKPMPKVIIDLKAEDKKKAVAEDIDKAKHTFTAGGMVITRPNIQRD